MENKTNEMADVHVESTETVEPKLKPAEEKPPKAFQAKSFIIDVVVIALALLLADYIVGKLTTGTPFGEAALKIGIIFVILLIKDAIAYLIKKNKKRNNA